MGTGRGRAQRLRAEALLVVCRDEGLLRAFEHGPLRGLRVSADLLRELLAEARLAAGAWPLGPAPVVPLPPRRPCPAAPSPDRSPASWGGAEELARLRDLLGGPAW